MKAPAQFSGANVVSTNIAGRAGKSLWFAASDDEQIFIDDGWGRERNRCSSGIDAEIFTKIDSPVIAETFNWLPGVGVQNINEVHDADDDAMIVAAAPVG